MLAEFVQAGGECIENFGKFLGASRSAVPIFRPNIMTDSATLWKRYQDYLVRYEDQPLSFSLDISRMEFEDAWLASMESKCRAAFAHLVDLEAGKEVNADEGRMVGHHWLRNAAIAPEALRGDIAKMVADAKSFAQKIHSGDIKTPGGQKFTNLLLIGIGGSALGPQLVLDALTGPDAPVHTWFLDNTDPDGIDRVLKQIGPDGLAKTLSVVTSKSGGTPETRNGMLEAAAAYQKAGLDFAKHAVAITGEGSKLDQTAAGEGWLQRFAMWDWVGGRTSVMSAVGLVPAALQGVDIDQFLAGAKAMDARTRVQETRKNAAMLLALMWHHAGKGRGAKDMVILPYKDRLVLFSKYLQQLVMESVGKEFERGNQVRVEQGIAVYGNKGSTDQHAYVQQLRDGINNFFATFIEVGEDRAGESILVDKDAGATSGDFLQGFLRGTRAALGDKGRESITLTVPRVDAFHLGALIALFERAVTFYADLVNINAYHQPGVEAGKKAAGDILNLMKQVRCQLTEKPLTADALAQTIGGDPEAVYHILNHEAANGRAKKTMGAGPGEDTFSA